MKVYENIERADEKFRSKLKEVIDDLVPLRDNRSKTDAYFNKHLENDWTYCRLERLHLTKQEHSERHF
jgi:hypothetical protein